jgi:serine carboxypeptidase-like clade 4
MVLYFLIFLNAGNSRWVTAMEWSGQMGYAKSVWKEFQVDGKEAGLTKGYGSLQFLKVFHLLVSSILIQSVHLR